MDLFERTARTEGPLADRMRPERLADVVGQDHVLGAGKVLAQAIRGDRLPSMVLWGPPGTGKTTLAQVVANETRATFVAFSAVMGGVPELRELLKAADERRRFNERRTVLFVDEIHRFNKAQQDALLPHVERGTVTLIGATTENPSFAVNAALLSRARVFELHPLSVESLVTLLRRALADRDRGLGKTGASASDDALTTIAEGSHGDARRALSVLELAASHALAGHGVIDAAIALEALGGKALRYDKKGEEHYNVVSAFIKSMRGSDADAAIYWMMRMVDAGEDPLFILRRMIIFASEDVGNADPRALTVAIDADRAFQRLGMPEGLFAMAQCCTYLATAPKSNASYVAFTEARKDVETHGALAVPKKLRNASTKAMAEWGYGDGYRYPHDDGGFVADEAYLPEELAGRRYYEPKASGYEGKLREHFGRLRAAKRPKV